MHARFTADESLLLLIAPTDADYARLAGQVAAHLTGRRLLEAWEASKHPRGQPGNAGEFGPGGEGKTTKPAGKPPAATHSPMATFTDAAGLGEALGAIGNTPGLSEREKAKRVEAARDVASRMTLRAVEHLRGIVKTIVACKTVKDVTNSFDSIERTQTDPSIGILGFWNPKHGILAMDGGGSGEDEDARGTLAHEIGHALDSHEGAGTGGWSNTQGFQRCYRKEIRDGQLSEYATQDRQEGFAEFARLVFGSDVPRPEIVAKFPMTWRFFNSIGLIGINNSGTQS